MRTRSLALLSLIAALLGPVAFAQQPPTRDARALAVLGQALAAMGGSAPSDSLTEGTIEIVEGANNERGSIKILTRGLDQSAELIQTEKSRWSFVYSRHAAKEERQGGPMPLSVSGEASWELAISAQSPCFP